VADGPPDATDALVRSLTADDVLHKPDIDVELPSSDIYAEVALPVTPEERG
jgi:hypothetical protein